MKNMRWVRFNKYLYRYRQKQLIVIGLGYITMLLSLINPYLAKLVIDKAYHGRNLRLFLFLIAIAGTIFLIGSCLGFFRNYISKWLTRKVNFDMTIDFFKHLQNLQLGFYANRSTGEWIYRINSDVSKVSNFICTALPRMLIIIPKLIFILVIAIYLDWKITALTILLSPLIYIQPYFFGRWLKQTTRRQIQKNQAIFRRFQEVFSHIFIIKVFAKKAYEVEKFKNDLDGRFSVELENEKLVQLSIFSGSLSGKCIGGAITLCGGYQVIRGAMSLGTFTAVMIYLLQLIATFRAIGNFYKRVTINSVAVDRLTAVLDSKPKIYDSKNAVDYEIGGGSIEFKDVCFSYNGKVKVLDNINFVIQPRAKVAIVGASGRGKSTLLFLLSRLYEPQRGSIFIDGFNIKDIKLYSLRSQISFAPQEHFLWNDTIAANILYGSREASYNDMIKAAKLAGVDSFVKKIPKGYNSVIGERGCKISEGQKQMISIARAIIKAPKVLVLDETMSSLDSETEEKIIDNIWNEYKTSTIIVVSHRLSTVEKADYVYFFQNQSDIVFSTHVKLLRDNLRYRELFSSQLN